MYKRILFFLILFIPNLLNSQQIILQQIETMDNFEISKIYFDYTIGDFYFKDFYKKDILVEENKDLKSALQSIFESNNYLEFQTNTFNNSEISDNIFIKKFLILDTNYQILDINNKRYFKFTIYYKKKKSSNNFFKKIVEQFKIEYGID